MSRYTHPDNDQKLLLKRLQLTLPAQPPPKFAADLAKPIVAM